MCYIYIHISLVELQPSSWCLFFFWTSWATFFGAGIGFCPPPLGAINFRGGTWYPVKRYWEDMFFHVKKHWDGLEWLQFRICGYLLSIFFFANGCISSLSLRRGFFLSESVRSLLLTCVMHVNPSPFPKLPNNTGPCTGRWTGPSSRIRECRCQSTSTTNTTSHAPSCAMSGQKTSFHNVSINPQPLSDTQGLFWLIYPPKV